MDGITHSFHGHVFGGYVQTTCLARPVHRFPRPVNMGVCLWVWSAALSSSLKPNGHTQIHQLSSSFSHVIMHNNRKKERKKERKKKERKTDRQTDRKTLSAFVSFRAVCCGDLNLDVPASFLDQGSSYQNLRRQSPCGGLMERRGGGLLSGRHVQSV